MDVAADRDGAAIVHAGWPTRTIVIAVGDVGSLS
jgi:hypothetical protein